MSKKRSISKEFKVGIIITSGLVLLMFGVNYLKGINIFEDSTKFIAYYDNVDGLEKSNPVMLNGLKVGNVRDVAIVTTPEELDQGAIKIEFAVTNKSVIVPSDTKAKIASDLLGGMSLLLEIGSSSELAKSGDVLQGSREIDLVEAFRTELEPLKSKFEEVINSVDQILTDFKGVTDSDATKGLPKAFESLQRTVETFENTMKTVDLSVEQNRMKVNAIMSNVQNITGNLAENSEEISTIFNNLEQISDSLTKLNFVATLAQVDQALLAANEITQKINNGDGSMGLLLNNDSLYNNLADASNSLNTLLDDLQANPYRYLHFSVFGKRDKKRFSKKDLKTIRQEVDDAIEQMEKEEGK